MVEHQSIMSSMDSYGGMDRPLFGESSPKDKYVNYALMLVAIVTVTAALICSFVHPFPPKGLHVFFAIVIIMNCVSNIFLIRWYREGDLDPKFRTMIIYNTVVVLLLCIVAFIIIFRKEGKGI